LVESWNKESTQQKKDKQTSKYIKTLTQFFMDLLTAEVELTELKKMERSDKQNLQNLGENTVAL